ncbi:hypothetical protein COCOR_04013 [Corallococcus coralloides DSM 2259]|uniref:Uncharacterized protein n=1 Tax=Corallococcus coralloides (strain ATCC 25202 / DSM 2259 / NBRC 100086 / M2) TaxID=1144275 RepID=H8MVN3_CORCM|nr:hypothetical protein [Corallococcus coralloides]AFE05564.1 hypothetical protein COCOR_04013 [Corallococcus coralloides DSM 2259]
MAYLTLSGIEVRCSAAKGLTQKPTLLGPRVRTFSGWAQSGTRSRVFTWAGGTPPMSMAEAQALRRLIDGDGHSWSFEANADAGLVSSKGLTGTAVGTIGVGPGSSTPRYGTGGLALAAGASVTWATATTGRYFVGAWMRGAFSAGAWAHVVVDANGNQTWLNGEEWMAADELIAETGIGLGVGLVTPSALSVSNRTAETGTPSILDIDDLVLLPYEVPRAWIPQWYAWGAAGQPFGALPYHTADGAGIPGPFRVLGQALDAQAMEYDEDGARVQGQYMDFELLQQPEAA